MRKLILIGICFVPVFFAQAQNLVPNYSFEDTIKCVQHDLQFNYYVANWTGQGGAGGLSYFTSNCTGIGYDVGVPSNIVGFEYARTGVSYAGIYSFISDSASHDTSFHDFRNYIEVKLTSPLANSTKYYVTFHVSCANTNEFACNDIGAYLSDSALVFDTINDRVKSNIIPQINNNPIANPLTDTLNWMKVTGTYVANGGEQYIVIGNFKNDVNSHTKYLMPGNPGAYYYIDDVFVTTDSLLAEESELRVKNEELRVFPNPNNGKFTVEMSEANEKAELEVYNMLGEEVYSTKLNLGNTTMDISDRAEGIYLYRVITETSDLVSEGKLIIEK